MGRNLGPYSILKSLKVALVQIRPHPDQVLGTPLSPSPMILSFLLTDILLVIFLIQNLEGRIQTDLSSQHQVLGRSK